MNEIHNNNYGKTKKNCIHKNLMEIRDYIYFLINNIPIYFLINNNLQNGLSNY